MVDAEAKILNQLKLIYSCGIFQVGEDEWEVSLYGHDDLDHDECVVRKFGNSLMVDDVSDTSWFYSVDEALSHLNKLGIRCRISLYPLWP